MKTLLLFILPVLVLAAAALAEDEGNRIVNQQEDLKRIRQEVERSEKRLDSLRNAELKTSEQVSKYDEKISANKKVISRLSGQLGEVKRQIAETEQMLLASRDYLDRSQRKYLGDIRHFYIKGTRRTSRPLWEPPDVGMAANRQVVYLTAVSGFESSNVLMAGQHLTQTMAMLDTLAGEQKKVQSLKKDKEVATALEVSQKEKKEKSLEKIRRTKLAEGEKMLTLQQAAEEIERVISLLEEERERKQPVDDVPQAPSVFATLKGRLKAPVRGTVVVPFGPATDPVTKLKSYSPGITVQSRAGAMVHAVGAGKVAYVGNLRGYGRFVIISHDNEYYTTYAGLDEPLVATGDYVGEAAMIGKVSAEGQLKFELRQGREPIDPIPWIRLDTF